MRSKYALARTSWCPAEKGAIFTDDRLAGCLPKRIFAGERGRFGLKSRRFRVRTGFPGFWSRLRRRPPEQNPLLPASISALLYESRLIGRLRTGAAHDAWRRRARGGRTVIRCPFKLQIGLVSPTLGCAGARQIKSAMKSDGIRKCPLGFKGGYWEISDCFRSKTPDLKRSDGGKRVTGT